MVSAMDLEGALLRERLAAFVRLKGGYPIPLAGAAYWLALYGLGHVMTGERWVFWAFVTSGAILTRACQTNSQRCAAKVCSAVNGAHFSVSSRISPRWKCTGKSSAGLERVSVAPCRTHRSSDSSAQKVSRRVNPVIGSATPCGS